MHSYDTESKTVVKNVDMPEDMQQQGVDCAQVAMRQDNIEKDIVANVKKEFVRL